MITEESKGEQSLEKKPYTKQISKLMVMQKNELISKAESLYIDNNFREAEEFLINVFQKHSLSTDYDALSMMGHIQIKLQKYDLATEYFKRAIDFRSTAFLNDSLGIAYYLKKNYVKSSIYFGEAVGQELRNIIYHLHLAYSNERVLQKNFKNVDPNNQQALDELKVYKDQIK